MIIVCDTFDYSDFPIYVMPGEDARSKALEHGSASSPSGNPTERNSNMEKVMEVYSLALPLEDQLREARAFRYD